MMRKLLGLLVLGFCFTAFVVDDPTELIKKISGRFLLKLAVYPQEKVYLQTDKPHYVAGERIWFRAYLVNAITHVPSNQSRYVYVELTDRQNSVLRRVKIARRDSVFQGYLPLNEELASGDYILRAYSYAMQSVGEEYLFKKQIQVINPLRKMSFLEEKDTEKKSKEKSASHEKEAQPSDIEVGFYPEGGNLLAGNLQITAFKAVDNYGMPVEISGVIENSMGDTIVYLNTLHDGMGRVRLPVYSGMKYTAKVETAAGYKKNIALPEVKENGVGVRLLKNDTVLRYAVFKGKETVLPDDLYVMIHTRGFVYCVLPVKDFPVGTLRVADMLEGIAHIVLFDSRYRIWSQRLCFVRRPDKPELEVMPDKSVYYHRELAHLDLGFAASEREKIEGSFSVAVVSDQKVNGALSHSHVLTDLLLTSDLKGYIASPDYYFEDTNRMASRDLDLVMLTHGWTRFDVEKEMKGETEPADFYVEKGQFVAGHVKNFSGRKSAMAQLLILSSAGHVQMVSADSSGSFLLEGIEYYDSTNFVIQSTKQNGKRNVEVLLDTVPFLPVSNFFPCYPEQEKEKIDFWSRYGQNYYYVNGQKVYLLEEVVVNKRGVQKYYNPVERHSVATLDSATIAGMRDLDIRQIIERLGNGIQVEEGRITQMGKGLAVLINDLPVLDFSEITLLQADHVKKISFINRNDAFIFYGDRVDYYLGEKIEESGGLLYITIDPVHRYTPKDHPSLAMFVPLGIQRPEEFYAIKYDRNDQDRQSKERDERSTIYWNPVVNIAKGEKARVSFYTADLSGTYTVTVEGVTTGGEIVRKKIKMRMK